ncbi:MAG TPA: PKD domain-containing protein [Planctomycetota bacterium]|nr:PKD domain-containing protein [Planctomycetota bacterium]
MLTSRTLRISLILSAVAASTVLRAEDAVATPPVIQGYVAALAVDAAGNRYVTGSFYDAKDFNPGVGADIKTPAGWSDLFVTKFNADGSYAWTQTVGAADSSTIGAGIVAANGTLYVTGEQFIWDQSTYDATENAIVVAFDAATGALKTGFGTDGTASYSGAAGATGLALTVSGGVVYATGELFPDWSAYDNNPLLQTAASIVAALLPKSNTFVWALDAASGASVAGFGTSGVATLSDITGNNAGRSIAAADGSLFVGGSLFDFSNILPLAGGVIKPGVVNTIASLLTPKKAASRSSGATSRIFFPYWGTQNAFIASLDATTGAYNTGFGTSGIKQFGGTDSVSGNGLAVSGGVVYLTGGYTKLPPPTTTTTASKTPTAVNSPTTPSVNSDIYVLAVNESTGVEVSTFGTAGVTTFGRQFDDEGVALAVDSGTVYVTGGYGDLTVIGGFFYPQNVSGTATGGGVTPASKPNKSGPPAPINSTANVNGNQNNTSSSPINAFGLPNSVQSAPNTTGGGIVSDLLPIWWYGGGGISDAFVLALDAGTGAPKTSFSGDGLQTFGGSDADGGVGIAVYNGSVIVAGYSFSTDNGIGGLGTIDATGFNAFLLTLDTATGGGGGAEVNTAPIVHAGDAQTVKIPQNKTTAINGDYQAWLAPTIIDDGLPNPPGTVTVKWEKVSGPGDVTFNSATDAFTAVSFSVPGVYVLKITASDSVLSASDTTTITVTQNHAPVIDSGPTATPATAATAQNISFTAAAHDPDGDDLYYWWDFGDGGYGSDASTTYAYQAPGTYTVTLHVDDGTDETIATVKVQITGNPIFSVDNLNFSVDFSGKPHSGSGMTLKGTVGGLPKQFNFSGVTVTLNAGGAQSTFTLDKSGHAKSTQGTFALTHKGKNWGFTAKLASSVIDASSDGNTTNALGLSNTNVSKVSASVPVTLSIGNTNFSGDKTVQYSISNNIAKGK